jgi:uncharacterized membrane protein
VRTSDGYEFYLKRNCSISPNQLAAVFIFLGTISVFIGIVFYSLGATLILPFSFLEVLALITAFFLQRPPCQRLRTSKGGSEKYLF